MSTSKLLTAKMSMKLLKHVDEITLKCRRNYFKMSTKLLQNVDEITLECRVHLAPSEMPLRGPVHPAIVTRNKLG
jgi:hypothetical protein